VVSKLWAENAREIAAASGQMPADRDRADAKKRADVVAGESFELVQDDDRAATWRQRVERRPYGGTRDQCGFCVCIPVRGTPRLVNVSLSNRDFTPLIPPEVDENADEPRLLVREAGWTRLRGVSGLQKR
jgi:hypothetical protein